MVDDYRRGLAPTGHWREVYMSHMLPTQLPAPATFESGVSHTARLPAIVRRYRNYRITPVSYVGAPILWRISVYEFGRGDRLSEHVAKRRGYLRRALVEASTVPDYECSRQEERCACS